MSRQPKEISPQRSQMILAAILEVLCDIANNGDLDELTDMERGLLKHHTEIVEVSR